ncbi:MAG: isoprenylcysteine carboxylmethyltransferase family protein [Bauldia sp.]
MLWLAWLAYWIGSSFGVKAAARSETWQSRLAYGAPLWVAGVLMVDPRIPGVLSLRFLPDSAATALLGVLVTAVGLGFAIWARVHLGSNWSAEVTVKRDHELVGSGPYALARHPIYTGLLLAFVGTAIVVGEWRGVLAAVIVAGSFWYKLGLEERLMVETFGAAYEDYRRRVKALVPFLL